MPINVNKQIQEAMARGDFDNLPGKGKPLNLDESLWVAPEVRLVNQILKENGLAPRWIELEKDIREERTQAEKVLENLKIRRKRLAALMTGQPFEQQSIQRIFELERGRALETYIGLLKGLNVKIQRFNLIAPGENHHKPLYNLDGAVACFHRECPGL